MVFFKMKDNKINYSKLEDLKPYIIGTITNSIYTGFFEVDRSFLAHQSNKKPLISERLPGLLIQANDIHSESLDLLYRKTFDILPWYTGARPVLHSRLQ